MISRVARYFTVKVLRDKGLQLCSLCDGKVIDINESCCFFCEQTAKWELVQ